MLSREARCALLEQAEQCGATNQEQGEILRRLRAEFGMMIDECTAHKQPDRSALLRMAGNIAGGLLADLNSPSVYGNGIDAPNQQANCDKVAKAAVTVARAILKEIDNASAH